MARKSFRVVDTEPNENDHHIRYPFTVVDEVGFTYFWYYATREQAEAKRAELQWESELPVGQRTSALLTDVRTVCSKAATTIHYASGSKHLDAEDQEIISDLARVVELLDRWQRTGRPPKYAGKTAVQLMHESMNI
ncbi:hypothetical protein EV193_104347 [Herbihabitans rhizosphaerae]|uniref:Uncharacterized protein n=1 Tax=Herbihabitans rhizosphaerae TaxID=1872711 RepID=A0A4Q7KTI6_9PSEU|nr:hypothetical protein [Herbihabitans rhizosphaerae]RZS39131.1 hypothetical protein EV193_104347 [Herbihabitans rhizosphaerae]